MATTTLVGVTWGVLLVVLAGAALGLLGVPLSDLVPILVATGLASIVRAALIEVRVTAHGVILRNFFMTRRFDWREIDGFVHGKDIHVGGRPFGQLLSLRLKDGTLVTALGTVSLTEKRLASARSELSRVSRSLARR